MTDDRTLDESVQRMRQFYSDMPEIANHYKLTTSEMLSVFAKILVQAHLGLGSGKEELLEDMSLIFDFENRPRGEMH